MTLLQRLWAYITLGAMSFLVEEASPLFGGVQAFDRNLRLVSVIIAVAIGTWAGGALLYVLGRWQGDRIRKRFPKLRPLVLQSAAIVRRHPWRTTLGARFAFGLRIPLPVACGVARIPIWLFLTGTAISCVAWSAIFTFTGFWLAQQAESLVGEVRRYVPLIGALLLFTMILAARLMRKRDVATRTKRVLDRQPMYTPPTGVDTIK